MFPEVTPAVARAVESAARFARAAGAADIEPLHVFHGLLVEEEGRAFLAATGAGLDANRYRGTIPPSETLPGAPGAPSSRSLRSSGVLRPRSARSSQS